MVYKVVSTKLTEEEHLKFLDVCSQEGLTPSALIKESIMMRIDPDYFLLPRKGYKTITVKVETFQRFLKAVGEAKRIESEMNNNKFVNSLLDGRKKLIVTGFGVQLANSLKS